MNLPGEHSDTDRPSSLPPPAGPSRSFPDPPPSTFKSRIWPALLRLVLFIVLSFGFTFGFAFVLAGLPVLDANNLALGSIVLLLAAVAATLLLITIADRRPFSAIALPFNRLGMRHLAYGCLIGASLSIGIIGLQWLAGWVEIRGGGVDGSLTEVLWAPSLPVGLVFIALAATGEELLFRGYGLQQLMRASHPWGAMIFSSVVFGAVHASNPNSTAVGVVNTVLFGFLFGLALLRYRSLWVPTGMHFAWNFSLACMGANISGLTIRLTDTEIVPAGPALLSGAEYGPEGSVLATIAVVAAGLLLWKTPLRLNEQAVLWDEDPPPAARNAPTEPPEPVLSRHQEGRFPTSGPRSRAADRNE